MEKIKKKGGKEEGLFVDLSFYSYDLWYRFTRNLLAQH